MGVRGLARDSVFGFRVTSLRFRVSTSYIIKLMGFLVVLGRLLARRVKNQRFMEKVLRVVLRKV